MLGLGALPMTRPLDRAIARQLRAEHPCALFGFMRQDEIAAMVADIRRMVEADEDTELREFAAWPGCRGRT